MRIEDRIRIFQIYSSSTKVNRVEKKKDVESTDKLEISCEARDFHAVLNAIKSTPDIREEKVNEIKSKIESGTYNVSAKDVVEKLIREYKQAKNGW
ncbi:anti-sigma-28 factor, FlgM [Caldicellulosiruptor saccharolyticus DSM 8903]|uniref:Negative regulator of flagellin synthesis n=1 Tax=Caldicellulosiruptor saccharolyticus (strain ATCC 43494 / DSM 8903 / Tp8T 6331) TaxID=351627 RepID=A4XK17_CALS8|nr:flagellar biosynthesis anti-sigma factor FlgM [Caldicellulosiruptor saccharolyticus]ABP67252.1 anti-sigma-28 factor, FlgM [Caldicellulosiruptor saccharolyticus DSM 8903]